MMKKGKHLGFLVLVGLVSFSLIACGGGGRRSNAIAVQVFDRGTDGGRTDPTNNNWTDWIKRKFYEDEGLEIEFVRISRWEEVTALNNLMAAGTPPDVCVTYVPDLVSSYRDLGGLYDMRPYIDSHLSDLKNFLGPDEALPGRMLIYRNQDPDDGRIFSLPARRTNTAMLNLFIREDWLQAVGLPEPRTIAEFHAALRAFRDQDPGNTGGRVVPFTMTTDVRWTAGMILNAFIDPGLTTRDRWIYTVVDRHILLPGYKDGVRFLNTLYNEGLIDRNFPLYTSDVEVTSLVVSGLAGSMSHNWDQIYRESVGLLSNLQSNVPGANLIPIDAIESRDGVRHKFAYDAAGLQMFIPRGSRHAEGAMKYLNWLARFENYNFLQIGPEGVTHRIVDGIPNLIATQGPWIQNSAINIDYTHHVNGLDLGDPEKNALALAAAYPWPSEVIAHAHAVAMANAAPGPVVPVNLSAAGPVSQTLIDMSMSLFAESITASPADFDRVWDSGIQNWLQSGAQSVIDERRAVYPF